MKRRAEKFRLAADALDQAQTIVGAIPDEIPAPLGARLRTALDEIAAVETDLITLAEETTRA